MPGKYESPLAKLENQIKKRQDVTVKDIEDAIHAELNALDKLYPKPEQEFEKNAHRDAVNKFKLHLMAERENLYDAWKNDRLEFFEISRQDLWEKGGKDLDLIESRPKRLTESYERSRHITDPEKGGIGDNKIDDYEGYDLFGGTRWSDETNAHNPTRNALSGYLTAMNMDSEEKAVSEYEKAHKIYEDKWVDDLTYEDLEGEMNMGKYFREIDRFYHGAELSYETKGYIAGLLKLADENYSQMYEAYRDYVFGQMGKLDLNINVPDKGNDYEKDAKRGKKQIDKMAAIQSAKEWIELFNGMQKAFEKLQDDAKALSEAMDFEYKDGKIKEFLSREPDSITPQDQDELTKVSELVASEILGSVLDKQTNTEKELKEINGRVNAYKGDHAENIRKEMTDILADFAVVKIPDDSSPDYLRNVIDIYEDALAKARVVDSRIAGAKKVEEEKKEEKREEVREESDFMKAWKNPEWVDPMFTVDRVRVVERVGKLPYRNDDGTRGGEIPGGTVVKIVDPTGKVKEVQGIRYVKVEYNGKQVWVDQSYLEVLKPEESLDMEFLEEKHLKESTDSSNYKYQLDSPKITTEGGQILILTQNKDIDRKLAWRVNDYLRIITEKEGDSLRKKVEKTKIETIADVRNVLVSHFGEAGKKESGLEARTFFDQMIDAYDHSVLQYETKPSSSKLREDYEEKILPAWDKLREEALRLPKRGASNVDSEKSDGLEGPGNLEKGLGLSSVNESYRGALRELDKYGRNPDKYPNGVDLALPFNNGVTPLNVRYSSGGRVRVEFRDNPVKAYTYPSMNELAGKMNRGHLQWIRTYDVMADKSSYKAYEHLVGKMDFVKKDEELSDRKEWQLHMEFDWEGIFDDPDVYIRPMRDGQIQYRIQWEHAKFNGKKWTSGYVENFDAFINVMAHIRQWGNKYEDIDDARLKTEQLREYKYGLLVHPKSFRKFESHIGRVVRLDTFWDDRVSMVLDWGGGNDIGSRQNARLDVSIGEDGNYNYSLRRDGMPPILASGTARTREEIAHAVAVERVKAGF